MSRIKYAKFYDAQQMLSMWRGKPESLKHIGNSASSVFKFENKEGELQILKLTDSSFRSVEQAKGELEFISHLSNSGCKVNKPVPSINGKNMLIYKSNNQSFVVTSFTFAKGEQVNSKSNYWNTKFFKSWGKSLGKIHQSSQDFTPKRKKLWEWNKEIIFVEMDKLIPKNDLLSRKIISKTINRCEKVAKTKENYGVIHGDYGPQNFSYTDKIGITSFDFGNSCYHYFTSDLANIILFLKGKEKRRLIKKSLIEGYRTIKELPANFDDVLSLFIKLRIQYIYLDRLYTSNFSNKIEDFKILQQLKKRVHQEEKEW